MYKYVHVNYNYTCNPNRAAAEAFPIVAVGKSSSGKIDEKSVKSN